MTPPRLLLVPDKFRDSITAAEFCEAASAAAAASGWAADGVEVSDGGEGFARIVAPEGEVREEKVAGPLGDEVRAQWRLAESAGRRVAVIEAAAACGLQLAGGSPGNDAVRATTRGVGELIAAGLAAGADQIIVGCGGSASTDGGRGALEALGAFPPPGVGPLGGAELVVAYDVGTMFRDAAARFGPQKGASSEQVLELERRLEDLAALYESSTGRDSSRVAGTGSAGGLAGGLASIGGRLRPGFEIVAEAVGLSQRLAACDAVVTGEGCLDEGSFDGKVVGGVIDACARPPSRPAVLCVVGRATPGAKRAARGAGAAVVVLSERFGEDSSFRHASALVRDVVTEWLTSLAR